MTTAPFPQPCRYEEGTRTIRTTPGNHWVATVDSWDGQIVPNQTAWGHLLAAAPDMLAALQWLDTLAEHLVIRHDLPAAEWCGLDRSLNSMVAHAKAAIAKARGEAA